MALEPGTNIGPYRVVEQAGAGGMATVYKAYQPSLARFVAIKVLPSHFTQDSEFGQRFQREAINVARLRHPNILTVFDYGNEGGLSYIVTEFVDGGTLADQLGTPLPVEYAVRMLRPVASAIDYAHALGVIHRDIKPSNILLWRNGTPTLSDFGLAKMMDAQPGLTITAVSMGTPDYMAPEQAAGEAATSASDLYALGIIVYQMATGRVPFRAETPLAVLLAHLNSPLPLPRQVNPAIPDEVEAVLLKALAKTPADRYRTATELIAALEAGAAALTQPVAIPPIEAPAEPIAAPQADEPQPSVEAETMVVDRQPVTPPPTVTSEHYAPPVGADAETPVQGYYSPAESWSTTAQAADDGPAVASFGRRAGAFVIDSVICIVIWVGWLFLSAAIFGQEAVLQSDGTFDDKLTDAAAAAALAGFFIVPLVYMWILGVTGQTLGMMALDLRVQFVTGRKLNAGEAFMRALILVLGASVVLGCLWPLWDSKKETWHDKVSNSRVVPTH